MRNSTVTAKARYERASVDYATERKEITFSVSDTSAVVALEQIKEKDLAIEIKVWREKRSLDANAYFWVLVTKIASALKLHNDDVYLRILSDYGVFTFITVKPEAVARVKSEWRTVIEHSEVTVNGQKGVQLQCFYGSSHYDTAEMSRLIDGAIYEAQALGIQTATPDEIASMTALWGV